MKRVYQSVLVLLCAGLMLPLYCLAAEVGEEDVTPRSKKIYINDTMEKNFFDRGKMKYLVSVGAGWDNNTHLDSQRINDGFAQTFFQANFTSPLTEKIKGILEYEFMNLMYGSESGLDLIRNGFRLGTDTKINQNMNFLAGYNCDVIEYIHSGSDDFIDNKLEFKFKQKGLPLALYHSLKYDLSYKTYKHRHTRITAATESDEKRADLRNTVEYEVGKTFTKDLLKIAFQYYFNNSNDGYIDFYDYNSYKISSSLTHLFNDKFFGYLSYAWQFRDYVGRTLILDTTVEERDKTNLLTSALYYNVTKAFTVGLSYTYRCNTSNEPSQKYSGSLVSLTSYYRF